ncbi:hypothetical protein LJR118_006721 [Acidovorax sp. LjRoot118]|uniref:hypothetical protein n=1 Tax=Acidovorax sp. LjRoot118 TaxID=3342256 RepID=UPI003ECC7A5E
MKFNMPSGNGSGTTPSRPALALSPLGDEIQPAVVLLTPSEVELLAAAVQCYRDLLASPTSADRDANGDEWADREVLQCDALLGDKLKVVSQ